jgi:aerobic-type carbon monoxide dehydrogenase small subunit (CoxS/CutS family)
VSEGPTRLTVNGEARSLTAPPGERLLDTLRWRLGLRGTKEGCRVGDCGACTVLVDGRPTLSCLTLLAELEGSRVETVEAVVDQPRGRAVAEAFTREAAVQCGYCTPGFVVALTGLLGEDGPRPSAESLLEDLQGNLCRCTGYGSIRRAVERARSEAP